MLESPSLRQRRQRFGRLFAAVAARRQRDPAAPAEAEGLAQASVVAAGPFARLGADLVCAVVEQLLRLGNAVLREAAVRDVAALLGTCRYVDACFRAHGDALRLEVAARGQTTVVPRDLATAARPYLDQVMREERSRVDLRILESAMNAMVTHCAAQHCKGARGAYNRRLAQQLRELPSAGRPLTPLTDAVLAEGPPPSVRVAWCDKVQGVWSSSSDDACCRVGAQTTDGDAAVELVCVSNKPARVFDPRSELEQTFRFRATPEGRVFFLSASPDGAWVAAACRRGEASQEHWCVCFWNATTGERACRREVTKGVYVKAMWFRSEGPDLLLVLMLGFRGTDETQPHRTLAVLQIRVDGAGFGPEDVPLRFVPQHGSVPGCTLLRPVQHADDALPVRSLWSRGVSVLCVRHTDRFCFACLCANKLPEEGGSPPERSIWQTVRVDCAAARAGRDRGVTEAVTRADDCLRPMAATVRGGSFLPSEAEASPDGWRVIVVGLRRPASGGRILYVHIYEHDGGKYAHVHSVRVADVIQRAYETATQVSPLPKFPLGFALSPCGRFVLLGLVLAVPGTHVAGLCILDFDDLHQGRVASGWVECRHDSVPRAVRWNRAGLWLETHEGVLLLGM